MISYICDRERAIVWGTEGGLPSMPQGLWLQRAGSDKRDWLGSMFSDVPIGSGDVFSRPTAGGGGLGDPLERDPEAVMRDVEDDYVSIERAKRDYGVVLDIMDADLAQYSIDLEGDAGRARPDCRSAQGLAERRPGAGGEALPGGRAQSARPGAPLRRDRRLGQWGAAAQDHRAVSRDDAEALRLPLERRPGLAGDVVMGDETTTIASASHRQTRYSPAPQLTSAKALPLPPPPGAATMPARPLVVGICRGQHDPTPVVLEDELCYLERVVDEAQLQVLEVEGRELSVTYGELVPEETAQGVM